jgi:hypothetical protein
VTNVRIGSPSTNRCISRSYETMVFCRRTGDDFVTLP